MDDRVRHPVFEMQTKNQSEQSIEREGKKLKWKSDFRLLEYNDNCKKVHFLYEDKEHSRYLDSMVAYKIEE